jgi:uncharacterized membrane protein
MESGMSKIDEVMEIKALRRVISAYLKFVFSVFFLLFFVFIIKKFRHSKSVTECVVVVVIVASVLIECPSLQTSKKTRQKAVFSLSLSLLDLSFQNPLDASFATLSSSSFFLWGW